MSSFISHILSGTQTCLMGITSSCILYLYICIFFAIWRYCHLQTFKQDKCALISEYLERTVWELSGPERWKRKPEEQTGEHLHNPPSHIPISFLLSFLFGSTTPLLWMEMKNKMPLFIKKKYIVKLKRNNKGEFSVKQNYGIHTTLGY